MTETKKTATEINKQTKTKRIVEIWTGRFIINARRGDIKIFLAKYIYLQNFRFTDAAKSLQ